MQYLAVGEDAYEMLGDSTSGLYADKVQNSSDVISGLTNICNRIFKRNSIPNFKYNEKIVFDVPISKLIVFAQGENISVGSLSSTDGIKKEADSSYIAEYSNSGGASNYTCEIDKSLKGTVATFEGKKPIVEGTYNLDISGANQVSVYYEPNVRFGIELIDADGNIAYADKISEGDYVIKAGFVNGITGKIIEGSSLLGEASYTLTINGQTYTINTVNGAPASQNFTASKGALDIKADVSYLSKYTESVNYSCDVCDKVKKLNVTVDNGYTCGLRSLDKEEKAILVTAMCDGRLLTEEEWNNTTVKAYSKLDVDWKVVKGTDVSTYYLYPKYHKGDMYSTDTGNIDFSIVASGTVEGICAEGKSEGKAKIIDDISFLDRIKHNAMKIIICLSIIALILGYIPPFKKYFPKTIKSTPAIHVRPVNGGSKFTDRGCFRIDSISTLMPYVAQKASLRYATYDMRVPKLKLKAAGKTAMIITNTSIFIGRKNITFDGNSIDEFSGRNKKIYACTEIKAKDENKVCTCSSNSR